MHLEKSHTIGVNTDVCHERTRQPTRDDSYRALHRFLRSHEAGGATSLERQLLDQRNVEIRADAEREQSARSALLRDIRSRSPIAIALADRRLPIGKEQH